MRGFTDPQSTGDVRLRLARTEDRDFFFAVRRAAFRPYVEEIWGWDDAHQRSLAEREFADLPVEIIEEGGTPVGYLCVLRREDHDFIDEIALLPEARGRGIGAALVRDVMRTASDRGVPVRLSVLVNNPARRLYESLGFRVTRIEHPRVKMEWLRDQRGN